uniref:Uncharacterized protein n=1 Tax=Glossina palpalis gambiensis TaxID=67801 RepID=A0A1B0BA46_9MUSC
MNITINVNDIRSSIEFESTQLFVLLDLAKAFDSFATSLILSRQIVAPTTERNLWCLLSIHRHRIIINTLVIIIISACYKHKVEHNAFNKVELFGCRRIVASPSISLKATLHFSETALAGIDDNNEKSSSSINRNAKSNNSSNSNIKRNDCKLDYYHYVMTKGHDSNHH